MLGPLAAGPPEDQPRLVQFLLSLWARELRLWPFTISAILLDQLYYKAIHLASSSDFKYKETKAWRVSSALIKTTQVPSRIY